MCFETSALVFMEHTEVFLEKSSTMVKKYLKPCKESTPKGPLMSACNKFKTNSRFRGIHVER